MSVTTNFLFALVTSRGAKGQCQILSGFGKKWGGNEKEII